MEESMSFLSKLFDKKNRTIETEDQAHLFIHEMEQLALQDPKNALKQIDRQRKSIVFQSAARIGGSLHEQFRKVVFLIWSQTEPADVPSDLLTVDMISWEKIYSLQDIFNYDEPVQKDIICLVPENPKYDLDALRQLIVLREFTKDSKVAMIIGEMDDKWLGALFLRKSFITMAAQALDPEIEEIIQEFIDFAKKQSLEVRQF